MDFAQLMQTRYSARKFTARPVARDVIREILHLAQQTPSWCNIQPWRVIVTSGGATERIRAALWEKAKSGAKPNPDFAFPPGYEGEHRERRKVCGIQLYQALGIGKDDREDAARQSLENFRLFDAPHLALIMVDDYLGFYGAFDCGLYVMSFMLAARELGVDTIAQAALASYPDLVREQFAQPATRKLLCGISFGYADSAHAIHSYRTERVALEKEVQFFD